MRNMVLDAEKLKAQCVCFNSTHWKEMAAILALYL